MISLWEYEIHRGCSVSSQGYAIFNGHILTLSGAFIHFRAQLDSTIFVIFFHLCWHCLTRLFRLRLLRKNKLWCQILSHQQCSLSSLFYYSVAKELSAREPQWKENNSSSFFFFPSPFFHLVILTQLVREKIPMWGMWVEPNCVSSMLAKCLAWIRSLALFSMAGHRGKPHSAH